MHGAGNDFVVVDGFKYSIAEADLSAVSQKICDRHFGVGADGLILVLPSEVAELRMRVINADGSEAGMCGNGIRVFAKYAFDRGIHSQPVLTVDTPDGIKTIKLETSEGKAHAARVDMGEPRLMRSEVPMVGDNTQVIGEPLQVGNCTIDITAISIGNPHCVTFVDNVSDYPVDKIGPEIENHSSFPDRTNVEFVEILGPEEINMRVWERGCGETLACGTGSCASVVAGALNGLTQRKVTVHLRGGDLLIEWLDDNHLYMTGPAAEVFEGEIEADVLENWRHGA
jgi:diaminopimelate epimerase